MELPITNQEVSLEQWNSLLMDHPSIISAENSSNQYAMQSADIKQEEQVEENAFTDQQQLQQVTINNQIFYINNQGQIFGEDGQLYMVVNQPTELLGMEGSNEMINTVMEPTIKDEDGDSTFEPQYQSVTPVVQPKQLHEVHQPLPNTVIQQQRQLNTHRTIQVQSSNSADVIYGGQQGSIGTYLINTVQQPHHLQQEGEDEQEDEEGGSEDGDEVEGSDRGSVTYLDPHTGTLSTCVLQEGDTIDTVDENDVGYHAVQGKVDDFQLKAMKDKIKKEIYNIYKRTAQGAWKCPYCPRTEHQKGALNRHIAKEHSKIRHECSMCPRSFSSLTLLMKHLEFHANPAECQYCGKTFMSTTGFTRHIMQHEGRLPTYQCEYCGIVLINQHTFEAHINRHNNVQPFECHKCGRSYENRDHLTLHHKSSRVCDPGSKEQHICHQCGKSFTYKRHYRRHVQYAHNEPSCRCHVCGRMLKSPDCLRAHLKIHNKHWSVVKTA